MENKWPFLYTCSGAIVKDVFTLPAYKDATLIERRDMGYQNTLPVFQRLCFETICRSVGD